MKIIGYLPADIVQDCQRISRILAHLQLVSRVMRRCQKMRHSCQSTQKAPPKRMELFKCWHYLSSRAVARQVLSARVSLTSVFGMGTGGPSQQSIPTSSGRLSPSSMSKLFSSNSFLIIAPNNSLVKHYFLRPPSGEAQRVRRYEEEQRCPVQLWANALRIRPDRNVADFPPTW